MPSNWNPDPIVLTMMEKDVKEFKFKIIFGGKLLTCQDVMEHVKKGTNFGKNYYLTFEKNLKESSSSTVQ